MGRDRETGKQDNYIVFALNNNKKTDKQDRDPYLALGKDRETDEQDNYLLFLL